MDSQLVQDDVASHDIAGRVAAALRKMADDLERNRGERFGGCILLVPPASDDSTVEIFAKLVLDSHPDPVEYWTMVGGRAKIAIQELDQQVRQGLAFGHR